MTERTVICPKCGNKIELTEAFTKQVSKEVEEKVREEFGQKYRKAVKDAEEKAKKQAEEDLAKHLKDLQDQLHTKSERLKEAEEKELALLKQQRDLEDRERTFKLEMERKLSEERKKIWDDAALKLTEENRLKEAERDKREADMLKQIEELKRKAEQGSQQSQGEILEVELENLLKEQFRYDDIVPVPKGVRGADVIQRVKMQNGKECGTIIWESKRTKSWSDGWIQKLKDDQRDVKANVAVIVSIALPKDINVLGNMDGVWIVDFQAAMGLATVLRSAMIDLAQAQAAAEGKNEKMEMMYTYLSGQEFRQRIEAIVESFSAMKEDLDSEKRAMEKIWSKREKQIERVLLNTSRLYGELQGIIGQSLQPISNLELPFEGEQLKLDE
ncbi:DUF2130 domain-containing protein [bacterium]|nr:DUF2130 domain-containing protein [bacterium]